MSSHLSPLARILRVVRRLRRRLLLHRRPLAALCLAAAVLLGLQAAAPPPPRTVQVWATAHAMAAGAVVRADDLVRVEYRPGSVPTGVIHDPRRAIGRALAAPVSRGEPLTGLRLVGAGLLRGYPGRTAVPLRITDADVVALLRVGDVIDVVVADPDGRASPRTLVEAAPVIAVPRQGRSAGDSSPGRLVVVAVATGEAADVAAAAATGILIPVWND